MGFGETAVVGRGPCWEGLETLQLVSNKLGDNGVAQLAQATHLPRLVTLGLNYNDCGARAAAALAESRAFPSLHALGLGDNLIGPEGAEALASSALRDRRRARRYNR